MCATEANSSPWHPPLSAVAYNARRPSMYSAHQLGVDGVDTISNQEAPPQYEESVGGKVNIRGEQDSEQTRGNAEFSPMYPYYNWGRAYNPDDLAVEGYQPGNNREDLEM